MPQGRKADSIYQALVLRREKVSQGKRLLLPPVRLTFVIAAFAYLGAAQVRPKAPQHVPSKPLYPELTGIWVAVAEPANEGFELRIGEGNGGGQNCYLWLPTVPGREACSTFCWRNYKMILSPERSCHLGKDLSSSREAVKQRQSAYRRKQAV